MLYAIGAFIGPRAAITDLAFRRGSEARAAQ